MKINLIALFLALSTINVFGDTITDILKDAKHIDDFEASDFRKKEIHFDDIGQSALIHSGRTVYKITAYKRNEKAKAPHGIEFKLDPSQHTYSSYALVFWLKDESMLRQMVMALAWYRDSKDWDYVGGGVFDVTENDGSRDDLDWISGTTDILMEEKENGWFECLLLFEGSPEKKDSHTLHMTIQYSNYIGKFSYTGGGESAFYLSNLSLYGLE